MVYDHKRLPDMMKKERNNLSVHVNGPLKGCWGWDGGRGVGAVAGEG